MEFVVNITNEVLGLEGKDGEVTKGAGKVIKKEKSGRLHALRST